MNEFIKLNWYHFDLNYNIIKFIKNKSKNSYQTPNLKVKILLDRIRNDLTLKIKED